MCPFTVVSPGWSFSTILQGHPYKQAAIWTQRPNAHTRTISPDCLPSMSSFQQVHTDHRERWSPQCFLSLTPEVYLFMMVSYSPIYHLTLLSVATVASVSCLSASQSLCIMFWWHCTTQHSTWLQTLRTAKLHRLPVNLGKCRAQASSKLLNNQCVPMVTSARTALAGKPA